MSDTLLLLRLEHRHADELLVLIEKELALGPHCDMQVLSDIAAYFLDYPDQCHHPVEDSVFRRLRARDPDGADGLSQLLEEHEYIADMSRSFAQTVAQAAGDEAVFHKRLPAEAAHFVERYRNHMHSEEREFFTLAEQVLTKDDWAAIEFDMFDRTDPLYDRDTENRFRHLRDRIAATAGQSFARAAMLQRSRELRTLGDVASFNRLMANAGHDYLLAARDGGGYLLQTGSEIVIDLPPCSEGRAAWCAWYFIQPRRLTSSPASGSH